MTFLVWFLLLGKFLIVRHYFWKRVAFWFKYCIRGKVGKVLLLGEET